MQGRTHPIPLPAEKTLRLIQNLCVDLGLGLAGKEVGRVGVRLEAFVSFGLRPAAINGTLIESAGTESLADQRHRGE